MDTFECRLGHGIVNRIALFYVFLGIRFLGEILSSSGEGAQEIWVHLNRDMRLPCASIASCRLLRVGPLHWMTPLSEALGGKWKPLDLKAAWQYNTSVVEATSRLPINSVCTKYDAAFSPARRFITGVGRQ